MITIKLFKLFLLRLYHLKLFRVVYMNAAMVNSTELKLEDIHALIQGNAEALDAMWVIITTFIIFTMQTGFGLLESGKIKFL